jgi:hypothetical protein
MQKLITISVDTKQIAKNPGSPFTINEVESVNEWLALGWEIEEWDFLKEGEGDGEVVLLVILNDDAVYADDFDDEFNSEDEDDEDYTENEGKMN